MIELFIRRPILSLVISLLITLLGILALVSLPVTQFPDIVPPSVVVTANYNGANADVCAKAVATPLERAINGVPGMTYMNSVSTNSGTTLVQVFFKVGTDPDQAAVNVQNRVTTVLDELPEEVIRAGVVTEKEVNSMLLYLNVNSRDSAATEEFIYNFTDINVLPELKRIEGVGFADIMGAREYSMRVWLKPDRMLAYSISTEEVIAMLRKQNVEAAPGVAGENSGKSSQPKQYVLKYTGKFNTPEEYADVVLKADANGSVLRLKDIADIEFGTVSYDMASKTDGRPAASIMIKQRPGSNAQEVIDNIKNKMDELKATTFPPGIDYNYAYDVSRFLDASIHEVLRTLVEAFILVFIVVFIFLQDFRSTLIPVLAVPVALIGTLTFLQLLGFSINMLTLFALVLAIGIVVDNAIVVVEAVHVKMNEEHLSPMDATIAAMKEITGALISITLVMSAVFIPVAFLSGPVGVFYRQFSLTLAFAIIISGINALTLTPALCALMLKHTAPAALGAGTRKRSLLQWFYGIFNKGYDKTEKRYGHLVARIAGRKAVTLGLFAFFCLATWGMSNWLPSGFIPTEDQSMVYVDITTPPGSTVDRTEEVLDEVGRAASGLHAVDNISTLAGYSLLSDISGASYGMAMINLKGWEERKETVPELIERLKVQTRHITDADIQFFAPPTVPGFGNASGFEMRLLDKDRGSGLDKMAGVTASFIEALKKDPAIASAMTGFDPNFPQYMIYVDQEMAAKKGVTIDNAMSTLQTLLGSYYATNFIRFGQMYKVMLQAHPRYRDKPEDVLNLYVKNDKGEMVPYSTFIRMEKVFGPEQITRYNMYTAAMITGDANPGFSSGQAIAAIEKVAKGKLPRGYSYEWSGMTREQILSGNQAAAIFLLCLIFVYLLLAAQYESFLLPLAVILSLPAGIFGAFFSLKMAGLENNIYAQVSLVMLIGLLGKNAILIVEFAELARRQGMSVLEAAKRGAIARLRPILMTSFAFIAGLIPLCLASGAGAMGNRSIGTAAAGGMLIGTLAGVFLVPGLYVLFANIAERRKRLSIKVTGKLAIVIFLAVGFSQCKVGAPVKMPAVRELPAAYSTEGSHTDTARLSSIASTKPFFTDPFLVTLIDSALANNPDLSVMVQRVEMARAEYRMGRGAMFPVVNGVISGGVDKFGDYTMNGVGNFDQNLSPNINKDQHIPTRPTPDYFIGFRSTWEADIWGKLGNRKKAALARLLATERGRHWMTTSLAAEVAHAYFGLLALDDELTIIRKNIRLQEEALEVVKVQKEGGRANELAVQQFSAQLSNTRAIEYDIRQQIVAMENQLNMLIGRYPQKVKRDTTLWQVALPAEMAKGVPSDLLVRRPDVQQAELELQAARADVAAARAAFLPSLTITPYVGFNAFRASLLFSGGSLVYGALAGLTAPLFNQGQLKGNYGIANARNKEAVYNYQKVLLSSVSEVETQLTNMENTRQGLGWKKKEVQDLQNAVSTARDLYLTGYASYLEVILAQKGVLEAELQLINLRKDWLQASVNLYRALGGGWTRPPFSQ
jgi:HAE1 family hydrophobic/amphiphilic exporter-1